MIRRCVAVALLLVMSVGLLSARAGAGAPVRVRITSDSGRVSGELLSTSADALTIKSDKTHAEIQIPLSSVTRAETSRGRHSRSLTTLVTAGLSFVVGVGSGMLLAVANNGNGIMDGFVPGLVGGIAAGAVTGVITAMKFGRERWTTVPSASLAVLVPATP